MPKHSAGILLYRVRLGIIEVLLVHPGGPFWTRRDAGAWSIPKGEVGPGEDPYAAAVREFGEETGMVPAGEPIALRPQRLRSGKIIDAWALAGDFDADALRSNS